MLKLKVNVFVTILRQIGLEFLQICLKPHAELFNWFSKAIKKLQIAVLKPHRSFKRLLF